MSGHANHTPADIRKKLNHPIVDGDGHWVEYDPVFAEQMRKVGGDKAADGFLAAMATTRDALLLSVEERRRRRVAMPGFWTRQTGNTLDRATAMMPHLLYEGIAELEFVTGQLGSKVGMFGSAMPRKVSSVAANDADANRLAVWYEVFGLDSLYDYDPVWETCRRLGIAPTFHSTGSNQALRNSPTNFTYNHIGHFADAGHAAAKGIFLGGVTRRFPELQIGRAHV